MPEEEILLTKEEDIFDILTMLLKAVETGEGHVVTVSPVEEPLDDNENNRTRLQNRSLHLWFRLISKKMNDAGYTHRKAWDKMNSSFDIPVTEEMVKDIAKNVSLDMFKKKKTSQLTTKEIAQLYECLNRAFGQSVGVSADWPSRHGGAFSE